MFEKEIYMTVDGAVYHTLEEAIGVSEVGDKIARYKKNGETEVKASVTFGAKRGRKAKVEDGQDE
jgi:hypothetical protein